MAEYEQVEYERCTVRIHPRTLEKIRLLLEESTEHRNVSEFIRAAVKDYLVASQPQHVGSGDAQKRLGSPTVKIRLTLPLDTYRKVVWQAENKYHVSPLDLMFRFINDQVMDFTYEDAMKYLRGNRDFANAEAQKRAQEERWLEP